MREFFSGTKKRTEPKAFNADLLYDIASPDLSAPYVYVRAEYKAQFLKEMYQAERTPLMEDENMLWLPATECNTKEQRSKPFLFNPQSSFYGIDVILFWLRETLLMPLHVMRSYLGVAFKKEGHEAMLELYGRKGMKPTWTQRLSFVLLDLKRDLHEHYPTINSQTKGWFKYFTGRYWAEMLAGFVLSIIKFAAVIAWWAFASTLTIAVKLIEAQVRLIKHLSINLLTAPNGAMLLGAFLGLSSLLHLLNPNIMNPCIQFLSNISGIPTTIMPYSALLLGITLTAYAAAQYCIEEGFREHKVKSAQKYWLRQMAPASTVIGLSTLLLHPSIQSLIGNWVIAPDILPICIMSACLLVFTATYVYVREIHLHYEKKIDAHNAMQNDDSEAEPTQKKGFGLPFALRALRGHGGKKEGAENQGDAKQQDNPNPTHWWEDGSDDESKHEDPNKAANGSAYRH